MISVRSKCRLIQEGEVRLRPRLLQCLAMQKRITELNSL